MSRPPVFPRSLPPVPPRPFQRTPPAIFLPILGLVGLGLALRQGAAVWGLPPGPAEAVLGAATGLGAFAVAAYLAKLFQRPGVLLEDLRVLPGAAGLATAVWGVSALALALHPYGRAAAGAVLVAALLLLAAWALAVAHALWRGPAESRRVSPLFHLHFGGPAMPGLAAAAIGREGIALVLLLLALPVAVAVWAVSLKEMMEREPPPPLRPLLALHLLPAAVAGLLAEGLGFHLLALLLAGIGGVILAALLLSARWLLAAGFGPLWGAMTFPLAAAALLMLALWPAAGTVLLVGAMAFIPPVALRLLRDWARGGLAARTNAARA